jgi:hypothetical protein
VQQHERAGDREHGDDRVDVHAEAPVERLGEHAAEQQPDRGAAAGDRAVDPERLVALGRLGERRRQQRERRGREDRAQRALEGAGDREHDERLRGATDRGCEREADQAADERPPAPEQVGDLAAEQQQ